jgi:CRP-like cAMP-binding protein
MVYPAPENTLLRTVPKAQLQRFAKKLRLTTFEPGQIIHAPDKPIKDLVFPLRGVTSICFSPEPGTYIEAAMVGSEGVVGLPVFLGAGKTLMQAVAHTPVEAVTTDPATFRHWLNHHAFLSALERYTHAFLVMLGQGSVCNRAHIIEKRCARWILTIQDRSGGKKSFHITRDFFSRTLGVRRASVGQASQRLEKEGLIEYGRAHLTILDRHRLEQFCCPCYRIIRSELDRLLPERPQ